MIMESLVVKEEKAKEDAESLSEIIDRYSDEETEAEAQAQD